MKEISVYNGADIIIKVFENDENFKKFINRKDANSIKYFKDNIDYLKNRLSEDDLYNFHDVIDWAMEYSLSLIMDKMVNNYLLSLLTKYNQYINISDIISLRSEMINYFAYDVTIHDNITLDDNDLYIYNDIIHTLDQDGIDKIIDEYSITYCKLLGDIDTDLISKVRKLFKKEFLFSNEGGKFLSDLLKFYIEENNKEDEKE